MKITGVVLAGGQGRRMGNVDKGLQPLHGKPMIASVLDRFAPQVDEVLINANRHLDHYAGFGYRVISDRIDGYAGPLAGLHCGLLEAAHPLVATVPCDSPYLPVDLIYRLRAALEHAQADLAVARTGTQPHPVFCLCHKTLAAGLNGYLAAGGRKIDAWYASLHAVEVDFADDAAFSNINTREELAAQEHRPR